MMSLATTRSTVTSVTTTTKHLEHPYNLRRAIERFERGYLQNILVLAGWDNLSAAKMLGIQPKTLKAKLKKYELL
jgi:DNA-binding NtrC family response regulator